MLNLFSNWQVRSFPNLMYNSQFMSKCNVFLLLPRISSPFQVFMVSWQYVKITCLVTEYFSGLHHSNQILHKYYPHNFKQESVITPVLQKQQPQWKKWWFAQNSREFVVEIKSSCVLMQYLNRSHSFFLTCFSSNAPKENLLSVLFFLTRNKLTLFSKSSSYRIIE